MLSTLRARILSWPVLLALVGVVVVVEFVVPRLTSGSEAQTPAEKAFARVCRDHGGTPKFPAGSGDYVKNGRFCEIRYGSRTYEMYAVHPEGFSEREAALAHRTCIAQAAQARADAKAGRQSARTRYVWHARSGICEEARAS
jgi:hypothetical protein